MRYLKIFSSFFGRFLGSRNFWLFLRGSEMYFIEPREVSGLLRNFKIYFKISKFVFRLFCGF
jgi:hypothetical protein